METLDERPKHTGLRIFAALVTLALYTTSVFGHGSGSVIFANYFRYATQNWGPDGRAIAERVIFLVAGGLGLLVLLISSAKVLASPSGRRATPELLLRWAAGLLFALGANRFLICIQSESVHFAQYGFVAFGLSFAFGNPRAGFLAAVFGGFLDEAHQWWYMYFHEVNQHLDWSDMCLNTCGAMCGALPWTSIGRLRRYAAGKEDVVETGNILPVAFVIAGTAGLLTYLIEGCNLGHFHAWPYWCQLDNHKPFHELTTREGVPALLALACVGYYVVDERRKNLPVGALVAALLAWHIGLTLPSEQGQPAHENVPHATVPRAKGPIAIDGKLDEKDWASAATLELHTFAPDATDEDKQKFPEHYGPELPTKARLLWDEKALYVAFECDTKDAWARDFPRDHAQIANLPCVEFFLDVDGAEHSYYEFEVSAANRQADYFVYFPELPQWTPAPTMIEFVNLVGWDAKHLETAVSVTGELDLLPIDAPAAPRAKAPSERYTVEMAIPWSDLKGRGITPNPVNGTSYLKPGVRMRANFYRVEPHRTEKPSPATYMAWGPTHAPLDFHRPQFFGELTLGE